MIVLNHKCSRDLVCRKSNERNVCVGGKWRDRKAWGHAYACSIVITCFSPKRRNGGEGEWRWRNGLCDDEVFIVHSRGQGEIQLTPNIEEGYER
jgi:hypothetical protein